MADINFFNNTRNNKLAFIAKKQINSKSFEHNNRPAFCFLSGYRSDMQGTKARFVADLAETYHFDYLRFDYSGHGASEGEFMQLTLSDWIKDAFELINYVFEPSRPIILIGSSMGGWIALKLMTLLKQPIPHFIGLAPAPDFSNILMKRQREAAEFQQQLQQKGYVEAPCDYDDGDNFIITDKFLKDADQNSVLDHPIQYNGKVSIIQGMQDHEVPFLHSVKLVETLKTDDVVMHLIKNAGHRLSEPIHLEYLKNAILTAL